MVGTGRRYRWLAVLPPAWMLLGVPFANRVEPTILGLPFLLAWLVAGVVMTTPILGIVWWLDRRQDRRDGASK